MSNHTNTNDSRRDDTLRRVQKLMDKANDAAVTTEERDAFLAKADALMAQYAIEQFEVDQRRADSTKRETPVVIDVPVSTANDYHVRASLDAIFQSLARHCGVMIGRGHQRSGSERTWKVVGYQADVDYLRMLYVSIQMHIVRTIEPSVDPSLTEIENYANLRDAGIEMVRIFQLLGLDYYTGGYKETRTGYRRATNDTAIARLRRQYRKLCEEQGREPATGELGEAYRLNFLWAYRDRLNERLREMRGERDEISKGHELVLVDREASVKDLLWETWPELRPHDPACECDDCHYAKCHDSDCKRPRCVAARKPVPKSAYRTIRYDARGAAAGRRSADSTSLARGSVERGSSGGALGS